jgi:hypothetical protein
VAIRDGQARGLVETTAEGKSRGSRVRHDLVNHEIVTKPKPTEVTDEAALLAWVKEHHPTEIVESVNTAFIKTFGVVEGQVPAHR